MIRPNFFALLPLLLFTFIHEMQAQTLFTYGNKIVSKSEFLRAYEKNNAGENRGDKSYKDYFELYIRFKIKVQAALDMNLDTLGNLKAELQNFRSQISENYLNDEGGMQELIDEAFDRSQKEIQLGHIFIPIHAKDSTVQIQQALARVNKAYTTLKQKTFEQVALEFSEDPTVAINKGNIGYITVFVLPYAMENVVYGLSPGQYCPAFRSHTGFHIFKNAGERKAMGRLRAAQILLAFPAGASKSQQDSVRKIADSIITLLQGGSNFKSLAMRFSNDNLSFENGGELPEFGIGRYDPVFESAAFALPENGAISKPVTTEFGIHIIKRLSLIPPQTDKKDQQWRDSVKQLIMQNDRVTISREKSITSILKKTNFKKLPYNQNSLWRLTDSVLQNKKVPNLKNLHSGTGLFGFAKQTVRLKDWQNYLESVRNIQSLVTGKSNTEIFKQFIETCALDYYRAHLEEFNNDFGFQLNEFKEGNLLFEVMQRKIWDVAAGDSAALIGFYQKNKNKYWWENSADAIIFTCPDENAAEGIKTKLKTGFGEWRKLTGNNNNNIHADSGRFELGQIPVLERTNFAEGLITANVKNQTDSSITFACIIKLHNTREPRNFEDARGFVISDYQDYLEDQWIASLKKKYPVKINEDVFKTLPK